MENCGNGKVDTGEQCDDGNTATHDDCIECRSARCGDGFVRATEECDQANVDWAKGCDVNCKRTVYAKCSTTRTSTCGEQCKDSDAACPMVGGYTAACNSTGKMLGNKNVCVATQ